VYVGVYDCKAEDCAPILFQEIKGADRALDRVSEMSNQGLRVHSSGLEARISSHTFLSSKAREYKAVHINTVYVTGDLKKKRLSYVFPYKKEWGYLSVINRN
jgi:hypothetical protein